MFKVTIEIIGPGQLQVGGFPNNIIQATTLMADAQKAVINYFSDQIAQGSMDDKGTVTVSKLILPKNNSKIIGA